MASMAKETSLQTVEISSKEKNTSSNATGIPPLTESSPLMSSFVDVLRRMPDNGGTKKHRRKLFFDSTEGQPDAPAPLDQSKYLALQNMDTQKHPGNPDVILLFGITSVLISLNPTSLRLLRTLKEGHRVLVHVTEYLPYIYHPVPLEFESDDLDRLITHINTRLSGSAVHCIELLPATMYPSLGSGLLKFKDYLNEADKIMENPVDRLSSFLHDCKLKPMFGVLIRAGGYDKLPAAMKLSHSQLEYKARYNELVDLGCHIDTAWRILSFSIKIAFPDDNSPPSYMKNSIIQIAAMVTRKGEPEPYLRAIFTLGACSAICGAEVHEYTDEVSLLLGWKHFLISTDPDVVTGYNVARFDLPYLLFRAKYLDITEFPFLGRLSSVETVSSSNRSWKEPPTLTGRLLFDVCKHVEETVLIRGADTRRRSLVNQYLNEFKGDHVDTESHNHLQAGGPDGRRQLAVSCLKDAYIPHRLLTCPTLRFLEEAAKAARDNNVPFNFYATHGPELPRIRRFK
ncbi:ribonuclease H-like domain-containing protein [Mycena vulgaris]|nr:ribonuclease H-like domain-containing protein [Mycena vulgaris]